VTLQGPPIPQTRVPSAPSSPPARRTQKAGEADGWCEYASPTSELRWPVPRRYAVAFGRQSALCGYPVHGSLPPTRRSGSEDHLVPGEAWDEPANPHANLAVLRTTRIASETTPMGQDAGGTFPKRGDYRFLTYTKPRSLLIPYIRTPPCIRPGLCVLPRMRLPRTRVNKSALQNTSTVSGQVRRRRLPGAAALRPLYQHKHALRAECEGRT
jgi:hypothetical protein